MSVTIIRKVSVTGGNVLRAANSLGDVASVQTSRTNLGLGTTAPTGTGGPVLSNTPTLVTPVIGAATGTSLVLSGNITASGGTALVQSGAADPVVQIKATANTFNPILRLEGWDRTFYVGVRDTGGDGLFCIAGAAALTSPLLSVDAATGGVAIGATSAITGIRTATATLNFGSIAAGASEDLTIAVTGAAVNDSVALGLPTSPAAGIIFQAFVSATNTVIVRATNITGSPVDPASATYRATVTSF